MSVVKKKIAGVILSAGDSIRMGEPKALLKFKGVTFLDTIIKNLSNANFDPLLVILGNDYKRIKETLPQDNNIILLKNNRPNEGQLSSLQIAINHLPDDCQGLLQTLVDHPLVKPSTYNYLYNNSQKYTNGILIPRFDNQRGHPVYFGRRFFRDLLSAPHSEGARFVVRKYADLVTFVDVGDEGIIRDIDTPAEYQSYV